MKILLTRPRAWGQNIYDQLTIRGHQVYWIPLIDYQFSPSFLFEETCFKLQQSDIAIFISQAAVQFAKPVLDAIEPDWTSIHWLAIGKSTAMALSKMGIPEVLTSGIPPYDSESLVQLPILQSIQGKVITILKGEGGRVFLRQILESRGAKVQNLDLYQRQLPLIDRVLHPSFSSFEQDDGIPDLSIVTSAETFNHYKTVFAHQLPLLKKKSLIVVGQRLETLAQESGFEKVSLSLGADDQNILKLVEKLTIDYLV